MGQIIARDALDAIDEIARAAKPEEIINILARALRSLGVEFFSFNFFPAKGRPFLEDIIASRLPADWLDFYVERGFAEFDPAIRHCRSVLQPFEYRTAPYDPVTDLRAREVVERAADFRLDKGLLVPVPSPAGAVGDVWMGGYEFAISERDAPGLHMLALYAFEAIRHLSGRLIDKPGPLTEREREILQWVAAGKSAIEIGDLLNLSHRTVEWHLAEASSKLHARNRVQAVVFALRDRLIQL